MYLPNINDAQRIATYTIGPYIAIMLDQCKSDGLIEYKYVMFVYLPDPQNTISHNQIVMAVAAEKSSALLSKDPENPSYFLGIFPGDGHLNLGHSTDWGNLELFTKRALEIIRENLNITHPARRMKNSDNETDD